MNATFHTLIFFVFIIPLANNIKKQIEILRDMKAKGEITDEEFKAIMFDIIKKS